jgi:hypothetical protein
VPGHTQGALELPAETSARLAELEGLSKKAESGDKEARKKLRRLVRSSSVEVIERASDIGRKAGRMLARSAAGGDPLVEEALYVKLDAMRAEIAGKDPAPLEALLTERGVSLWMLTALLEVLVAAQYRRGAAMASRRASPTYIIQQSRILEGATRRYLAAIRELARVRKLEVNAPGIQVNTQINLGQ